MRINEIILAEEFEPITGSDNPELLQMAENLRSLVTTLKRTSQMYLTSVGGIENALFDLPLYRGVGYDTIANLGMTLSDTPFAVTRVRKNRIPKDTPKNISTLIDEWFLKKTDIPFRSQSLFCVGKSGLASSYGYLAVIVPKDNFNYCWSPKYRDMYESLEQFADVAYEELASDPHQSMHLSMNSKMQQVFDNQYALSDFLEMGDYQLNAGLQDAIKTDHEIMIASEEAYVIKANWLEEVKFHVKNQGWKL